MAKKSPSRKTTTKRRPSGAGKSPRSKSPRSKSPRGKTAAGKHPVLWQSRWDISEGDPASAIRGAELHFVRTPTQKLETVFAKDKKAQVEIDGRPSKVAFHYVFVDEADSEAVSFWNAKTISGHNAKSLAAGKAASAKVTRNSVPMSAPA